MKKANQTIKMSMGRIENRKYKFIYQENLKIPQINRLIIMTI
jgi:hypothetical protein